MISEMAVESLEEMKEKGLEPTFRDIIRLNALGLKVERSQTCGDYYAMPRVTFLGSEVFREPTIAHVEFIDLVRSYVNAADYGTDLSVRAFALSRMPEELPDAANKKLVVKSIEKYLKNLKRFTVRQIAAAVDAAESGWDAAFGEYPALTEEQKDFDEQILRSIGTGVLIDTSALGLGMSLAELRKLTPNQARMLQTLAWATRGNDFSKQRLPKAQADYYATEIEIKERLLKEKNNGK